MVHPISATPQRAIVRVFLLGALIVCLSANNCVLPNVTRPAPMNDKPPVVTISYYDVATQQGTDLTTSTVVTLPGTDKLQLFSRADNPGGVKSFTLTLPTATITVTNTPDANNQVPTQLGVSLTDGHGGPGKLPIFIFPTNPATLVTATATNFNGMTSTPVTITFLASPTDLTTNVQVAATGPGQQCDGSGMSFSLSQGGVIKRTWTSMAKATSAFTKIDPNFGTPQYACFLSDLSTGIPSGSWTLTATWPPVLQASCPLTLTGGHDQAWLTAGNSTCNQNALVASYP